MYTRIVTLVAILGSLLSAQAAKTIDRYAVEQIDRSVHVVRSVSGKYKSFNDIPSNVRNESLRASLNQSALGRGEIKQTAAMVTFVVASAGDDEDPDLNDGVYSPATLRSAIQNANLLGGSHAIAFASGITVIQPATQLPSVNVNLTIDGTVTAGKVILDGSLSTGTYGLTLGKPSTVKNMIFKSWKSVGLGLGFGSNNSVVQRCEFTLNNTGLNINGHNVTVGGDDPANGNYSYGNKQDGIAIVFANDNIIKNNFSGTKDGLTASPNTYAGLYVLGERNLVTVNLFSGNDDSGLEIGEFSLNTIVDDNFIGMDLVGSGRLPNKNDGITTFGDKDSIINNIISGNGYGINVLGQASQTYIGNNTIGSNISYDSLIGNRYGGLQILGSGVVIDNNVISNNKGNGISITGLGGATVKRNYIGTNQNGMEDWGNTSSGIYISCDNNIIGGPSDADCNFISGNGGSGIEMYGGITISFPGPSFPNYVQGNLIQNNYIGADNNGSAGIPNKYGITMQGYVDSNFVRENLISGNLHYGVWLRPAGGGPTRNVFTNNFIGTATDGKTALPNFDAGVYMQYGSDNLFGGPTGADGNLISGNNSHGIWIDGAWENTISYNTIGVNDDGLAAIPNWGDGIAITSYSTENVIQSNLISGNVVDGVLIAASPGGIPDGNIIIGNTIGMDYTQLKALPNNDDGITINNARNTRIGGATFDSSNFISGNSVNGIFIYGDTSRGNLVRGNYIGTTQAGDAAIPNYRGMMIWNAKKNSVGGADMGAGNLISGNLHEGVYLYLADSNSVSGNIIGLDLNHTKTLPNENSGIVIDSAHYNIIGGDKAEYGNAISGNKFSGIALGAAAKGNKIYNNAIGTDYTGTKKFGNEVDGIQIVDGAHQNWIGKSGAGNWIKFNKLAGVFVADSNQNRISENSIFGNGELGIDLAADFTGVSPNDELDADGGGNDLQNFPELFFADGPFPLRVVGTLKSKPNETYTLEIFSNSSLDSTKFGEGENYVGSWIVGTDSTGFVHFNFSLPVSVSSGMFISATATDFDGNTSEFSKCVEVKASDVYVDIAVTVEANVDTLKKGDTLAYTITLQNYGPDSATQVVLKDTLSKRLTYISDSTSKGNAAYSNGILTVTIDSLAAGEKVYIVLTAVADSTGLIFNRAFASAQQADFDPSNNSDTDTSIVPVPLAVHNNSGVIPALYNLYQNYPNPFNPSTNIQFDLPVAGFVTLKVFDMLGREVAVLVNEERKEGVHAVHFDGSRLASGVYLYTLRAGNYTAIKKLLLLK